MPFIWANNMQISNNVEVISLTIEHKLSRDGLFDDDVMTIHYFFILIILIMLCYFYDSNSTF